MKHILSFSFKILIFLFVNVLFAQNNLEKDSINVVKNDSLIKSKNKTRTIFVGVDFFSIFQSIYSNKKSFKGVLQYQFKPTTLFVIEGGYESNTFNRINWKVNVAGFYTSLGLNYFIVTDKFENKFNGFYIGGRIANALYSQEILAYPVYGENTAQLSSTGKLPKVNINSTWVEMVFGGRVDFVKKKLYGDISFRPKLHLFSTQQESIKPIVVPGFGINKNNLNIDIMLSLVYQLNFNK